MAANNEQTEDIFESIDPEIKQLLLSSPGLNMDFIANLLNNIKRGKYSDLEKVKDNLRRNIIIFNKKLENGELTVTQASLIAREHIDSWSQKYGKPLLKEILKIADYTNLPVFEIIQITDLNPAGITDVVDDYVIGQNDYIDKLSLTFYTHYLRTRINKWRIDMPRANLLVYGPSGVGKTFAVQILAKVFKLNMGIVSCNSLVQEGIVGPSISNIFTELYIKAGKKLEAVENAIIFFDEFDKLLEPGTYNERIINEILNIIDDDGYAIFNNNFGNRYDDTIRVSTKNMLFIFSGVFQGLKHVVHQKRNENSMGFLKQPQDKTEDFYRYVEPEDFRKLNIKNEVLGRIHEFAYVRELSAETIVGILLDSAQSPILPFLNYFSSHGVELILKDEAAEEISKYVVEKKLGARGIKSLLWQILSAEMGEVGNKKDEPGSIVIDKKFLKDKLNKKQK